MELLGIASAILCCTTLLRHCKTTTEKVKEIIVTNGEKCKDKYKLEDSVIESTDITTKSLKTSAPPKPPRGVKQFIKKSDNSHLQKNISANNVHSETFCNDDYIRSKVYKCHKNRYNQCHRISSEKEARFQEASVQSERHSKDALLVIKSQEIPSSKIDIDSSKSVPSTSELIKVIQLRVTNSSESRTSQLSQITIINDKTTFVSLPNKMKKEIEKNVSYPLTSTKLRSKNSSFHKLRKSFVAGLHRIFRLKNEK